MTIFYQTYSDKRSGIFAGVPVCLWMCRMV